MFLGPFYQFFTDKFRAIACWEWRVVEGYGRLRSSQIAQQAAVAWSRISMVVCSLQELVVPLIDLVGVDVNVMSQFDQGLFAFDRGNNRCRLEGRRWFRRGRVVMVISSLIAILPLLRGKITLLLCRTFIFQVGDGHGGRETFETQQLVADQEGLAR